MAQREIELKRGEAPPEGWRVTHVIEIKGTSRRPITTVGITDDPPGRPRWGIATKNFPNLGEF